MINKMIHTPEGVRDIYGMELARKTIIKNKIQESLCSYGFMNIETPGFEFSDIYSNDVGTTPEKEMYRFFDKEGNMLVLRPDFTPSVARCAAKYFVDESMPIKLCYVGNAYNNISELQGKLKETTQIGAEFIGDCNSTDADGEMICLVIDSLLAAGLKDFTVSIGNVEYFKGICEAAGLTDEQITDLREYISIKNIFGAEEFLLANNVSRNVIKELLDVAKFNSYKDIASAKELVTNERSLVALEKLENVFEFIKAYGFEKYVSLDLAMVSKLHYYSGTIFRAYTYGTGDAIVKGGRYDTLIQKFGKDSTAVGLVFLVDDIMSALSAQNLLPAINDTITYVVYSRENTEKAFAKIKEIRANGGKASAICTDSTHSQKDYENYARKNGAADILYYL